jgi:Fis family transcriptional regulator, factor for inversion stimulation protein
MDQERKRGPSVKDQLEALVAQMYQSGILYSEAVREFRKRFILTVLEQNNGNQCKAAQQLGMHRNTLSRTITELDLDVRAVRAGVRRPPKSEKAPVIENAMGKKMAR